MSFSHVGILQLQINGDRTYVVLSRIHISLALRASNVNQGAQAAGNRVDDGGERRRIGVRREMVFNLN